MTGSSTTEHVEALSPASLKEQVDRGERVVILDARAPKTFEEWRIEAPGVELYNFPYYDFMDGVPEAAAKALPSEEPIIVLCAKGESSEMVADALRAAGYTARHLEDGMNGWAELYESATIEHDGTATIVQYRRPSSGCLAYLVASEGEAAIIDPLQAFTDRYIADINERDLELRYVLDTHIHADHISGVRALANETAATAVLPAPAIDRGVEYDIDYETVSDGETLMVGGVEIAAIHTPGHTSGMTSYRVEDIIFTGDGLFTESVARPDLEDPKAARKAAGTLYDSLQDQIFTLPGESIVAPAHYSNAAETATDGTYTARLDSLRTAMPILTAEQSAFVDHIVEDMPPRPANYEDIIATNLGVLDPDDDEAFELELGPNNCAASETALSG